MACIRVRFITADGFVSAAIRWVTGSLFSHVEFGTPEGTWIGAHSDGGVQERPADYCTPTREYVYEIPCTQAQRDALMAWARSQIGAKYNFWDIFGLLIKNRKLTSLHRLICSQFYAKGMLLVFGPKQFLNVAPGWEYLVTPETGHLSPMLAGHLVKKIE